MNLSDPHVCIEDHQIPRKKSEERRPEEVVTLDKAQDHWNTFDLSESVMRKKKVFHNGGRPEV